MNTKKIGTLLIRLMLGLVVFWGGLQATIGFAEVIDLFASLGLPLFLSYLIISGELIGGIALILGLYSRLVVILLLPILVGATYYHLTKQIAGNPLFPASLAVMALAIYFQGSGFLAIRRLPLIDKLIPPIFHG